MISVMRLKTKPLLAGPQISVFKDQLQKLTLVTWKKTPPMPSPTKTKQGQDDSVCQVVITFQEKYKYTDLHMFKNVEWITIQLYNDWLIYCV